MQEFSAQTDERGSRGGGLSRAGDILKRQHSDVVVSRHKLRQAEGITLVREKRESGNQILAFATRAFRSLRTTHSPARAIDSALRAVQRLLHRSDHRPSHLL